VRLVGPEGGGLRGATVELVAVGRDDEREGGIDAIGENEQADNRSP
jgi:hypothetical protein